MVSFSRQHAGGGISPSSRVGSCAHSHSRLFRCASGRVLFPLYFPLFCICKQRYKCNVHVTLPPLNINLHFHVCRATTSNEAAMRIRRSPGCLRGRGHRELFGVVSWPSRLSCTVYCIQLVAYHLESKILDRYGLLGPLTGVTGPFNSVKILLPTTPLSIPHYVTVDL